MMNQISQYSIDLSISPLLILLIIAVGAIVYALWPSKKEKGKQIALVGGAVAVVALFAFQGVGSPNAPDVTPVPPAPQPGPPLPGPTPAPSAFGDSVMRSFDGSRDEAVALSALFGHFAAALAFDGGRSQPRLTTVQEFGNSFQELQRYHGLSEAPWANRFGVMKGIIAAELASRGVGTSGNLDSGSPTPRSAAISVFNEVSTALARKAESL